MEWLLMKNLIHSFIPDIYVAPLQVHYYSEALPTTAWYCVRVSTPKRYRTSEGLAQGPYLHVAAEVGFEPATF